VNDDQARMWVDRALYGASFARRRGDGSYERVDPRDVRREMEERAREPTRPGEPGYDDEHGDRGKQEDRLADSERGETVAEREPLSDAERGRAFLERLGRATEASDRDAYLAGAALFDLLEMHEPVGEIEGHEVVALGRVLRGSE
jgi:hypothetical protein